MPPKISVRLWPPIANAFDAYRRRVLDSPDAVYEHIWRLIHIHEALIVTLASALAMRLKHAFEQTSARADLDRLRSYLTGLRTAEDEYEEENSSEPSPLGGSINSWIDLLNVFGLSNLVSDSPFCNSLAMYLNETNEGPLAFAVPWSRIAPVPEVYADVRLPRITRFHAINALRNKFAHVPVPQRLLEQLHRGLRAEVMRSLTPNYDTSKHRAEDDFVTIQWRRPLAGRVLSKRSYITGSSEIGQVDSSQAITDGSTQIEIFDEDWVSERWVASPFFRVDEELKIGLLFRVADLKSDPSASEFIGEYHRFAAELEPVQEVPLRSAAIAPWLPAPPPAPVAAPPPVEHQPPEVRAAFLRNEAERAFRARDYRAAVDKFTELVPLADTTIYNDVARSKHGAALWRVAERLEAPDTQREEMFREAIGLLERAATHRDPRYSSRANYERSKALWHLWKSTGDRESLDEANRAAGQAASKGYEDAYLSWQEKVAQDLRRLDGTADTDTSTRTPP